MAYHTGIYLLLFLPAVLLLYQLAPKKADGLRCWQPATFFLDM